LKGTDNSQEKRNLFFQVLSFPSHGTLPSLVGDSHLVPNHLTPSEYDSGLRLSYTPPKDFFTYPNKTWAVPSSGTQEDLHIPEVNFTVQMLATSLSYLHINETHDNIAYSSPFTSSIEIQNVNDPTFISFTPFAKKSKSSQSNNEEGTFSSIQQQDYTTDDLIYSGVTIEGFQLIDHDNGVNPVRIRLNTTNGKILLNQNAVSLLDFSSNAYCKYNKNTWRCHGNGEEANRNLIFVGTPKAIEKALNGMTFYSTIYGEEIHQNISITIYDGVGGDCFSSEQLLDGSVYEDCFITRFTLQVQTFVFACLSFLGCF
jgi:hypothetical protein